MRERDSGTDGTFHPFRRTVEETVIISTVHRGTFHAGDEETKLMPAVMEPEVIPGDNSANYPQIAKNIVHNYISAALPFPPGHQHEPYIVWFCKTLQNWKALLGSPFMNGKYYEVTFNGDKNEIYLDEYVKACNVAFKVW